MPLKKGKENTPETLPRVLVVDDENITRMALWHILKDEFDVTTLESGNKAVEQIRQGMDFDVVSLDLKMPGMSGIETLKVIKELSPAIEVLLVTAYSDIESAKQALKFGAYDYIDKPVDRENYRESVRTGVQRRRQTLASERTREQLETVKAQLVQSEKLSAIGELLAGVVHEINNPLSSILGYSELLLSGRAAPEKAEKYLENIRQSALLCQKTVKMLLAFSRKQEPQRDFLQIRDIINSTLDLVQHEIKSNNINVAIELEEKIPQTLADYYQIQQVFLNIFNNAVQGMKQQRRPGKLTIKSEFDGAAIRISIIDTGPGIPPEHLQKVFEPFFTTKPEGKGTGLGLSISLGIIQEHGGDIYIASEPGKGSCFIVEIPMVAASEPAPGNFLSAGPTRRITPQNILLIEHEKVGRDLLENMIAILEHRVDVANDAGTAQEKIRDGNYDIIISNIFMPGIDVRQLFGLLQRVKPELCSRTILVAGGIVDDETKRFLEENRTPCIHKPFRLQDVQDALQKVVNPT